MPFCLIPNDELSKCFMKNCGIHENYQKQLKDAQVSAAQIQSEIVSTQENLKQQLCVLRESASRERSDFISKQENMNKKLEEAKNLELNLRRRRDSLQEQLYLGEHKLEKVEDKLTTTKQRNSDLERENLELQSSRFGN